MKTKLLEIFEQELKRYPWAKDKAKLQAFMESARATLHGGNLIDRNGPAFRHALTACGLPEKITLDALHHLPE